MPEQTPNFGSRALLLLALLLSGMGSARAQPGHPASTAAHSPRIVVLLPQVAPAGIDGDQLRRSLGIYLRDLPLEVIRSDEDPATVAPAVDADFVVWFAARAESGLIVFIRDRAAPAEPPTSFVVEHKSGTDPSFYRVTSLKLRSELRAILLARRHAPTSEPPAAAPPEAPPAEVVAKPPPPHRWALEIRATGAIPTDLSTGLFFVGLGAYLRLAPRWALGLVGSYTIPSTITTDTGESSNTGGRVAAAVRARLAGRPSGRGWGLWAEIQVGIAIVHSSAHLTSSPDTRSATAVLPLIGAGFPFGYRFNDRLALLLTPRVEVFPIKQDFTVRGTVVYSTGWALPALDLALQISL